MIQQSVGHFGHINTTAQSVHIQMGKIKYEPTAFLASSSMSSFEYVKCSRNICMRKKNSFRPEKKATSSILSHFSGMWDTIHIYISIFRQITASWGEKQFVRDRILAALTHVPSYNQETKLSQMRGSTPMKNLTLLVFALVSSFELIYLSRKPC